MKRFFAVITLLVGTQLAIASSNPEMEVRTKNSIVSDHSSGNWNLFAGLLYWVASEEPSSIWADISTTSNQSTTFEGKNISFDWHYGFRTGIGYNMVYDLWDTQLYWTWYRTEAKSRIPKNNSTIITEFFAGFVNKDIAESAKIRWTLLYNMFDWELGRSILISRYFSFRPFIGIKGGWIWQEIHSHWDDVVLTTSDFFASAENLKNNFWGIGPSGGINTQWKMINFTNSFLSLFGDFSVSTLWGKWICKDKYRNSTPKEITVEMKNSVLGSLTLRGAIGLGWGVNFNKGKSRFVTRLGYEMQFWLNQLRIPTFQQLRLHGDLTLQGGVLDCRLDF